MRGVVKEKGTDLALGGEPVAVVPKEEGGG